MRILKIRLSNLNSLLGEFQIDLNSQRFLDDGIFLICGPTGSGKTTILDAICLAMYGRTPRLNSVSKSSNEIMSRQAGECFAEVEFLAQGKQYLAHFSQRRARAKTDGALQQPMRELSCAGEILATRITEVERLISDITGMDFERFTRSMLLAQGQFATFLQASGSERAPLLEQITGSEIYSQISMRVHQRTTQEQIQLQSLNQSIAELNLMSSEELEALSQKSEQVLREVESLKLEVKRLRAAHTWLERQVGLNKSLEEAKTQLVTAQEKLALNSDLRERHSIALKAQQLEVSYQNLLNVKEGIRQLEGEQNLLRARLLSLDTLLKAHQEEMHTLSDLLIKAKQDKANLWDTITRVQPLDEMARDLSSQIEQNNRQSLSLAKQIELVKSAMNQAETSQRQVLTQTKEVEQWLQSHQDDESIASFLPALQRDLLELQETEIHFRQVTEFLTQSKVELSSLSGSLDDCRLELLHLQALKSSLETEWSDLCVNLSETVCVLSATFNSLSESRQELVTSIAAQEKNLELLQEKVSLLEQIRSLSEHRDNLTDNQPCPLCGSLDHPYSSKQPPAPDQARAELNSRRQEIRGIKEKLRDIELLCSKLQTLLNEDERQDAKILTTSKAPPLELMEQLKKLRKQKEVLSQRKLQTSGQELEKQAQIQGIQTAIQAQNERIRELMLQEAQIQKKCEHLKVQSENILRRFACANLSEATLNDLNARHSQFVTTRTQWTELQTSQAKLQVQLQEKSQQLSELTLQEKQAADTLQQMTQRLLEVRKLRQELFGDKDRDQVWQEVTSEEKKLEDKLSQFREQGADLKAQVQAALENQSKISGQLNEKAQAVEALETELLRRLSQLGFSDLEGFLAARLSPEELSESGKQLRLLDETVLEAKSALSTIQAQIVEHEAGMVQISTEEMAQLQDKESSLSLALQESGSLQERLREQDSKAKKQFLLLQSQQKLRAVVSHWENLNGMIGAHDGKKFRNFAQGLTFEVVVQAANHRLRQMSDRYCLLRSASEPLELLVRDNYQAGIVRSTKNLSGGESFIVSLALALGLATISSSNLSLDCLFLDEGFGTLDEQALEIALETLASLRRDGKLIGVISHVPLLRERIGTQIALVPHPGGHSSIRLD